MNILEEILLLFMLNPTVEKDIILEETIDDDFIFSISITNKNENPETFSNIITNNSFSFNEVYMNYCKSANISIKFINNDSNICWDFSCDFIFSIHNDSLSVRLNYQGTESTYILLGKNDYNKYKRKTFGNCVDLLDEYSVKTNHFKIFYLNLEKLIINSGAEEAIKYIYDESKGRNFIKYYNNFSNILEINTVNPNLYDNDISEEAKSLFCGIYYNMDIIYNDYIQKDNIFTHKDLENSLSARNYFEQIKEKLLNSNIEIPMDLFEKIKAIKMVNKLDQI